MALPYVDVASPILRAYFEGKNMRLEREAFENRKMVEQQKIEQDKAEMAQRNKLIQGQQKLEADRIKQQGEIHSAVQAQNDAQHKMRTAIDKARLSEEFRQGAIQYGGAPKENVAIPMTVESDPVNTPMNVQDWNPMKGQEGFEGFNVDLRGVPQVPLAEQGRRDVMRQRAEDNEARLMSQERMNKDRIDAQNQRAHEANQLRETLAESKKGGDPAKVNKEIGTFVGRQLYQLNNSEVGKKYNTSKRGLGIVDDVYNRSVKVGKPLKGIDGVNLVLNYLQTVTPANRITDFEFRKTAYSDSKINEIKRGLENWFSSNMLTPEVAQSLMHEIKEIHKQNSEIFNSNRKSIVDTALPVIVSAGGDPNLLGQMLEASDSALGVGSAAPKEPGKPGKPLDKFNSLGYRNLSPGGK